ncbi:MAG: glycosyltransferase family 2 protein [Bacteroidia bacterium]
MPLTSVVILNWNGKKLLEQFLPFVAEYSGNAEVIVADNASTDDSIEFVLKNFPGIQIIKNDKNYGFAEGYNVALQWVKSKYIILLNSDVEVTPGWIDPLISQMEADERIGAVQPKIKSWQDKQMFEYAGAAGGFIDKWGYPFCRGRIFNDLEEDLSQYNTSTEVFWATGACMAVRADVFLQAGGFDSDFFAHMEEIDLCWRIKNLGYKIYCSPDSIVYHVGGGTLNKYSPRKTYLNFRNNLMMMIKNLPKKKMFRTIFIRLLLDGIAAMKFLLAKNGFQHFVAVVKAHYYVYSNFNELKEKRYKLRDKNKYVNCIYKKSIVLEHFVFNKKKYSELDPNQFS